MAAKLTIAEKKAICWEVNEAVRKDCYRSNGGTIQRPVAQFLPEH